MRRIEMDGLTTILQSGRSLLHGTRYGCGGKAGIRSFDQEGEKELVLGFTAK